MAASTPVETVSHDLHLGAGIVASLLFLFPRTWKMLAWLWRWASSFLTGPMKMNEVLERLNAIEKATHHNNWLSLQAISASGSISFISDHNGGTVWVSDSWCELANLPAEKALADGWIVSIHPEDSRGVWDEWEKCVREKRPFRCRYRFLSGDDVSVRVECRAGLMPTGGFFGNCKSLEIAQAQERRAAGRTFGESP